MPVMMGQLQLTNLNLSLGNHLGLTHTIIYFGCPIKAAFLTTPVHIENLTAGSESLSAGKKPNYYSGCQMVWINEVYDV